MPADRPDSFVQSLREIGIVTAAQADEIARTVRPRFSEVRALARELVQRGTLTAFQEARLLDGRGKELVLGSYLLLDQLGEGGMGEVYKARHLRMDRVVALKLIRKDHLAQPEAIKRFFREARAAAQLSHPNIVAAHDAGEVGSVHFLAMEYIDGVDLAQLVQQSGPLAIPLACDFIRQAALGLQHAFEKGVVHRDIKPSNLVATRPPAAGPALVKILDFGLARFESESSTKLNLTRVGKVVGTVDYISPEQAENARKADIRSDIYSLGCTLFYLLTGQPPFAGQSAMERLTARLLGHPTRIRALRPEVPEQLDQVVGKMLARDPAQRFQTPVEVATALEAFRPEMAGRMLAPQPHVPTTAIREERPATTAAPAAIPTARPVQPASLRGGRDPDQTIGIEEPSHGLDAGVPRTRKKRSPPTKNDTTLDTTPDVTVHSSDNPALVVRKKRLIIRLAFGAVLALIGIIPVVTVASLVFIPQWNAQHAAAPFAVAQKDATKDQRTEEKKNDNAGKKDLHLDTRDKEPASKHAGGLDIADIGKPKTPDASPLPTQPIPKPPQPLGPTTTPEPESKQPESKQPEQQPEPKKPKEHEAKPKKEPERKEPGKMKEDPKGNSTQPFQHG